MPHLRRRFLPMNLLSHSTSSRKRIAALAGSVLTLTFPCSSLKAAAIVGWQIGQGTPVTSGLDTNSPTIGDGSPENADASSMFASFPTVSLLNSGDSIVLTGTLTLSGILATDAGTNQQLRFGLFDRVDSPTTSGWLGYFVANSTSVNAGVIRRRNAGNTDLFISNSGSAIVASTTNPPHSKTGAILADDTYAFALQIVRDGDSYDIAAFLTGGPGGNFNDSYSIDNLAPAATETYSFNHVGFLHGGAMNADQVQYNNIEVTFVPEPGSLSLCALGGLFFCAARRRPSHCGV